MQNLSFISVFKIPQCFLHHIQENTVLHDTVSTIFFFFFFSFSYHCRLMYPVLIPNLTQIPECMERSQAFLSSYSVFCCIFTSFHQRPPELLFTLQNSACIPLSMCLFLTFLLPERRLSLFSVSPCNSVWPPEMKIPYFINFCISRAQLSVADWTYK